MRSDNPTHRLPGSMPGLRSLAAAAILVLIAACAHSRDDQKLVGDPVASQTREQLDLGRDKMIGAMASFIRNLDREVCRRKKDRSATQKRQLALSEAYLEVTRAIEEAEDAATPTGERQKDRSIVWMNVGSPGPDGLPRIRWQCRNAPKHRQCVRSTANSVARLLFRSKFEGYSLEAERMADLLATAGADIEWALGLARRTTEKPPGEAIAAKCRAGESPLRTYLFDAEGRSIGAIRDGIIGEHPNFCTGLSATYLDVIESLRAHFEQSLISQRCPVDEWSAIDD